MKTDSSRKGAKPPRMKNVFRVPKKRWRKWSALARKVFNEVYEAVKDNAPVLFPPGLNKLPAHLVKVIAWNTAWIAADSANVK